MAFGVPPAIIVDNYPTPKHRFNFNLIGRGTQYANQAPAGDRCIISIQAGTAWKKSPKKLLLNNAVTLDCHISTDTQPTVFQAGIAHGLKLPLVAPFFRRVNTFLGSYTGWWCKQDLWLSIGPGYMPLEVLFPVQHGAHGWGWRFGLPQWNVLGMRDVLNRRMLCVTSEHVFSFERI
jgi:hypothetical protein